MPFGAGQVILMSLLELPRHRRLQYLQNVIVERTIGWSLVHDPLEVKLGQIGTRQARSLGHKGVHALVSGLVQADIPLGELAVKANIFINQFRKVDSQFPFDPCFKAECTPLEVISGSG